jgi:5-methyltetrahydrofolate--homocysteine methyltransferase
VGGKGIDEEEILPEAVKVVAAAVDLPISIDTRNPAALEKALALCPGRPLVNSIGCEDRVLAENLPIAAAFGRARRCPVHGPGRDPQNEDERLSDAPRILDAAVRAGVGRV